MLRPRTTHHAEGGITTCPFFSGPATLAKSPVYRLRNDCLPRRAFDTPGLPPRHEEVYAFLSDREPDACKKLMDRLQGSLDFDDRWAADWLDVHAAAHTA
jgi:hypothetical protein